jgi:D-serine dehydratase
MSHLDQQDFDFLPFKGLPLSAPASDRLPSQWAQGKDVLKGELSFPLAVIKRADLLHNIAWMKNFCDERQLSLAPHGKTSMSPELWRMQLEAGAWGISFATVQQAVVGALNGVPVALIANQVVQRADLDALHAIHRRFPKTRILFLIDSVAQVEAIERWAADRDFLGHFDVLLELGEWGHRTGIRDDLGARQLAQRIRASQALVLAGVECYEGTVVYGEHAKDRAHVTELMDRVVELAKDCLDNNWFEGSEMILSAGGSAIFDLVAERLRPEMGIPVRGVLRSGCYLTTDHHRYGRYMCCVAERLNLTETLRPALELLACVQSQPEPGLAFLSMGKRDVAQDLDLPQPIWRVGAQGQPISVPSHWRIHALNDHHAFLHFDDKAPKHEWPKVGETVAFGISHPCTTFDKWRWIPIVDDQYRVVDGITTWF